MTDANHSGRTALVVTTINTPGPAMRALASGCDAHGWDMIVAGDRKTPGGFTLAGAEYLSIDAQRDSGFALAGILPEGTYARKNLGYLEAMRRGAGIIVETDDDNFPEIGFWEPRTRQVGCRTMVHDGWVNAYAYFSDAFIYPRGMPLEHARDKAPELGQAATRSAMIQQGLADKDPDVDAVYRMLFPLPLHFDRNQCPVLLGPGTWCPFNSQNTTFFKEVFPLMYLPTHCSFRMTDIWRSFVAQRVLHELGEGVMFHGPTVWQERNEHDLRKDFADEISGYVHNSHIRNTLLSLEFPPAASLRIMVESCYQAMIRAGHVGKEDEHLLAAWFDDLEGCA